MSEVSTAAVSVPTDLNEIRTNAKTVTYEDLLEFAVKLADEPNEALVDPNTYTFRDDISCYLMNFMDNLLTKSPVLVDKCQASILKQIGSGMHVKFNSASIVANLSTYDFLDLFIHILNIIKTGRGKEASSSKDLPSFSFRRRKQVIEIPVEHVDLNKKEGDLDQLLTALNELFFSLHVKDGNKLPWIPINYQFKLYNFLEVNNSPFDLICQIRGSVGGYFELVNTQDNKLQTPIVVSTETNSEVFKFDTLGILFCTDFCRSIGYEESFINVNYDFLYQLTPVQLGNLISICKSVTSAAIQRRRIVREERFKLYRDRFPKVFINEILASNV